MFDDSELARTGQPASGPNRQEVAVDARAAAGSGDGVADFCVLPDDGLVLFILRRGKEGSAEAQLARAHQVHPSRLAHGVPLGGELEYVDRGTLSHAFGSRSEIGE